MRVDYHGYKEVPNGTCHAIKGGRNSNETIMIDLKYSLVIEATDDPSFFGFYSPELERFSGVGSSIEDCLSRARAGMAEHVAFLKEAGLEVPAFNPNPVVTVKNSERIAPAA